MIAYDAAGMGREGSPLRDRVIFVEGAPRSGTTWLVTLLATHPEIAGARRRDRLDLAWLDDEKAHAWVAYGYEFDERRSRWRDRPSVILRDVLRQYTPGGGRPVTDAGRMLREAGGGQRPCTAKVTPLPSRERQLCLTTP